MTDVERSEGVVPAEAVEREIPPEIAEYIERFANEAVAPIAEDDPDTAEWMAAIEADARRNNYHVLQMLQERFSPQRVLYPAPGFDELPERVFGGERVVYTNLEGYQAPEGELSYASPTGQELQEEDKGKLSYVDGEFDTVLLLHVGPGVFAQSRDELARVLKPEGVILLNRVDVTLESPEEDPSAVFAGDPRFETVPIPDDLQGMNDAGVEYSLFQKKGGEA